MVFRAARACEGNQGCAATRGCEKAVDQRRALRLLLETAHGSIPWAVSRMVTGGGLLPADGHHSDRHS